MADKALPVDREALARAVQSAKWPDGSPVEVSTKVAALIADALIASPVLRALAAEVWDAAYGTGWADAAERPDEGPWALNPYREQAR